MSADASSVSANEQRELIKSALKDEDLRVGQIYYVIAQKWYQRWKDWVCWEDDDDPTSAEKPDAIDNSALVLTVLGNNEVRLHGNLQEEYDYMLLPETAWKLLYSWYQGGPVIARSVIGVGEGAGQKASVEVYPLFLQAVHITGNDNNSNNSNTTVIDMLCSRKLSVKQLKEDLCKRFHINNSNTRIWADVQNQQDNTTDSSDNKSSEWKCLSDDSLALDDATVADGQRIIIESSDDDDDSTSSWPMDKLERPTIASKYFSTPNNNNNDGNNNSNSNSNSNSDNNASSNSTANAASSSNGGSKKGEKKDKSSKDSSKSSKDSSNSNNSSNGSDAPAPKKRGGIFSYFFGGGSSSSNSNNSDSNSNGKIAHSSSANGEGTGGDATGLCGLSNLGNTCFMNSALQCLSNTAPLTEYFLSNTYKGEINKTNPLGMKGRIAEEYANLVKQLWAPSSNFSCVAPRNFKVTIGKFAPQFSGFSQHDSQELLAFLLDGLHEDLNRVTKKPYIEAKENDTRPEEERALEAWEDHLKRNQSIIVDLFQGQLKSTLVCPKCSHVSKTWDPFMYLSLPLPFETEKSMVVTVIKYEEEWNEPVCYAVRVNRQGKIGDLKKAVCTAAGLPVNEVALADVYEHRIYTFLNDGKDIAQTIRPNDQTYAYQHPPNIADEDCMRVQVLHRVRAAKNSYPQFQFFGMPFLLFYDRKACSGRDLYEKVWMRVRKYVTMEDKDPKQFGGAKDDPPGTQPWPFKLKIVSNTATSCGNTCNSRTCVGCELKCNSKPVELKNNGHTLAIDWDTTFLKNHVSIDNAETRLDDKSVKKGDKMNLSLNSCLKLFTTNEKLGANDPWYCPKCKEFQQAMKKFDLWKLPQILVIHLKRFQYSKWSREKLGALVDFPLEGLDLSDYVKDVKGTQPAPIYDLFAVSNHSGGLGGGHYTAYGKNKNDGNWYLFNDSSCSPASPSAVLSPAAYVLFYSRRSSSPPSSSSSTSSTTSSTT